jgi:hypothetical protein
MTPNRITLLRLFALTAPVGALVAACGGGGNLPTRNADLMAGTTVGKYRCEVGKENDRPFVVEWDSTDLANFESKTQRDIVFVKIDGCNLKVLDCRDDGIAGQYGAYDSPKWTSGTVEGFDIKNEGELYAKLPLGAVSLSGSVQAGNELHLKYFVSGTRPSLRNAVYRGDIAKNPLCASATHFVSGYDLGAFEVTSSAHDKEAAGVNVGNVGGGGSLAHEQSHLKNAGKLDDCTGDTAKELSRCKVPIRLSLRAITDGDNPSPPENTAVTKPPEGIQPGMTPQEQAMALGQSAMKKMQLKDGPGCILDLDRMAKLDPKGEARGNYTMVRAQCEMLSGKCEQGKKRYRTWLEAVSPGMDATQLDTAVSFSASTNCGKNQGTPREIVMRARTAIYDAARKKKSATACAEIGRQLLTTLPQWKPADEDEEREKKGAGNMLKDVADCMAQNGGDCAEATKFYTQWATDLYPDGVRPKNASPNFDPKKTRDAIIKGFKCPQDKP